MKGRDNIKRVQTELDNFNVTFKEIEGNFLSLEEEKKNLVEKKEAKAAEEAAATALSTLAGNITSKGQAKTALETALGGIDDDIAAQ